MRHKAAVATVLEFIAKGKKMIRESTKLLNGEFYVSNYIKLFFYLLIMKICKTV
jgi:hypothetical protein